MGYHAHTPICRCKPIPCGLSCTFLRGINVDDNPAYVCYHVCMLSCTLHNVHAVNIVCPTSLKLSCSHGGLSASFDAEKSILLKLKQGVANH